MNNENTYIFENLKHISECKTTNDKFLFLQYMGYHNLIEEKEFKLINERYLYITKRKLATAVILPGISYLIYKQNKLYSLKLRIAMMLLVNIPVCSFVYYITKDYNDFIDFVTFKYTERIHSFYFSKQSPLVLNPYFLEENVKNVEMNLLQKYMLSIQENSKN